MVVAWDCPGRREWRISPQNTPAVLFYTRSLVLWPPRCKDTWDFLTTLEGDLMAPKPKVSALLAQTYLLPSQCLCTLARKRNLLGWTWITIWHTPYTTVCSSIYVFIQRIVISWASMQTKKSHPHKVYEQHVTEVTHLAVRKKKCLWIWFSTGFILVRTNQQTWKQGLCSKPELH